MDDNRGVWKGGDATCVYRYGGLLRFLTCYWTLVLHRGLHCECKQTHEHQIRLFTECCKSTKTACN